MRKLAVCLCVLVSLNAFAAKHRKDVPPAPPAEKKLVALLTVLIEEYEAKHDPVPDAEPASIIRHLMEAHNLRQKDLLDVFGTESIVSEVLHGKRELTKQHIRRLSKKFNVSPAVFF